VRQIFLDTETTGLEPELGHRIIEIGCVEMINRRLTGRHYHQYIQPEREIDDGAIAIHGITNEFLSDKPLFQQIAGDFLSFIEHAELIIHNAPFDMGFIRHELEQLGRDDLRNVLESCRVTDTLLMAREKHPGQRNTLDALCRRYEVDNSHRELHGALLDAEILADVYLRMTGGQVGLALSASAAMDGGRGAAGFHGGLGDIRRLSADRKPLPVIPANEDECRAHEEQLKRINERSEGQCLWLKH
jgi:DNA polymerase-3 subunit epsilon